MWSKREHSKGEQPGRGGSPDELDAGAVNPADVGKHQDHGREQKASEHERKLESESAGMPAGLVRHVPSELDRPERELAGA
jgi:hypothetical protein